MPTETICAECGRVEEPEELRPVILRGRRATVCLRCLAEVFRWVKVPTDESEPTNG